MLCKKKKDVSKNVSIEEIRKSCNIIWGEWIVRHWSDAKIKKMYKLYHEGYFNLR